MVVNNSNSSDSKEIQLQTLIVISIYNNYLDRAEKVELNHGVLNQQSIDLLNEINENISNGL